MKIKKINKIEYSGKVYNLGVADNNNYFCNNILVHNCYVSANKTGRNFEDICEKAEMFFGSMKLEDRPFQVAVASAGSAELHTDFIKFMKTLYNLGIVPNWTSAGVQIAADDQYSKELIQLTKEYCGGIAVSVNKHLPWEKAVEKLVKAGDININLHVIISDRNSVENFRQIWEKWKDDVLYFVLLPLMPAGRSTTKYDPAAFDLLLDMFPEHEREKLAFGAHFYDDLLRCKDKIKVWSYPPESLSANINFDTPITITKSSFEKEPVMTIEYEKIPYVKEDISGG